jgi:hypothetical protein
LPPGWTLRGLVGDKEGRFDWKQHYLLVNDATNGDCGAAVIGCFFAHRKADSESEFLPALRNAVRVQRLTASA